MISGNVSFYNQSASGRSVAPSPIVACVGIVDDYTHCRSQRFKDAGRPHPAGRRARGRRLAGSLYLEAGFQAGPARGAAPGLRPAPARDRRRASLWSRPGLVTAAHDISDGGLAVCLSEMAMGLEARRGPRRAHRPAGRHAG